MAIERRTPRPAVTGLSMPGKIVVGALAAFGLIVMVQWLLAAVLGLVKWALFAGIVVAVAAWVVSAKGRR